MGSCPGHIAPWSGYNGSFRTAQDTVLLFRLPQNYDLPWHHDRKSRRNISDSRHILMPPHRISYGNECTVPVHRDRFPVFLSVYAYFSLLISAAYFFLRPHQQLIRPVLNSQLFSILAQLSSFLFVNHNIFLVDISSFREYTEPESNNYLLAKEKQMSTKKNLLC